MIPAAARATTAPQNFVNLSYAPGATFPDPTALAFLPDGRLLVAVKHGHVWVVTNGQKSTYPLLSLQDEVCEFWDRGLIGLAVDPDYVHNRYIYLLYTVDPDADGNDETPPDNFGRLTRYQMSSVNPSVIDSTSRTVLMGVTWRDGPLEASLSHTVGSLRWGADGSLLVSVGEGASATQVDAGGLDPDDFGSGPDKTDPYEDIGAFRAQSLSSLCGKILRINPATGAGYRSNPYFDGDPYSKRSRVFQYGFRNPFRFCVRPGTGVADTSAGNPGTLYIGDVGMQTWEEIDVARTAGMNFGWPCYEGVPAHAGYQAATPAHNGCGSMGSADNPASQAAPLITWNHNNPGIGTPPGFTGDCAVGGTFYSGLSFPAAYQGAYFFGDWVGDWIRVATVDGDDHLTSVSEFMTGAGGPSDFVVDPTNGDLVYTAFATGEVRRIHYSGPTSNQPPVAFGGTSVTLGPPPLTVDFSSAGSLDPEGGAVAVSWRFGDGAVSTQPSPTHTYDVAGVYPAVLTVTDGGGGVAYDTVTVVVGSLPAFPATPVLDDFNRADGALGPLWVDNPNGLSIANSRMLAAGAFSVTEWSGASFGPNQEAYVTIVSAGPQTPEQDLMLKVQGNNSASGTIEVRYLAAESAVGVFTYARKQGWVQRGSIPGVTYAPGRRLGARAFADGTVQVFRDTTLLGSVSVSGWPFAALGGRIGLSFTGNGGARYDDFGGGNVDLGTIAPVVTLTSPTGGETWVGGSEHPITWTASDDVGVTGVDVFYQDAMSSPWRPLSLMQANDGAFSWWVPNLPTPDARVKIVAHDVSGNTAVDSTLVAFSIQQTPGGRLATTLRDFHQPGTQPLEAGAFTTNDACYTCHGGYNAAVEPGNNWRGSMMAQASRDPLFLACLAVAEQDAPSSGDLCLRCHAPMDWLMGNSQPTSGARLSSLGKDGVSCDFCHRMVDPEYKSGVSPAEDQALLASMLPSHVPTSRSNGQFVVDRDTRRRGPFTDPITPHPALASSFHGSSDLCGTCHDLSNPVFVRIEGAKYIAGPLDAPADTIDSRVLMPMLRTYSEWRNSAYPAGVFAPQFAGNAPAGMVSQCQDCHMRQVIGAACNYGTPPTRSNLPLHDMTGGNAWAGNVVATLDAGETDAAALTAGAGRAVSMLQKAATVDVTVAVEGDSTVATVVVTNLTGHKLPTGFPEGRRMWLNVVARDADGAIVYQSCSYDTASGDLTRTPEARVFESKLGLSPSFAASLSLPEGPGFHLALNDTVYQDNRIPPAGFTQAAFDAFGGAPVDPGGAGYADGQNWDVTTYRLPPSMRTVTATLYYQTTTREYVEFLNGENTTNVSGQTLLAAWQSHGRAAPVAMARDSVRYRLLGVSTPQPRTLDLRALTNPFRGQVELLLSLPERAEVRMEILDVLGRVVKDFSAVRLEPGEHRLPWNGRTSDGHAVHAGAYWARVRVGDHQLVRSIIALR